VVAVGIVLAFVIIASATLLYILSNKASEEEPKGSINLISYIDGAAAIGTEPLERVSLNCESNASACQDAVSAFEVSVVGKECQKGKDLIKISGIL
jgi:hypothetical protein